MEPDFITRSTSIASVRFFLIRTAAMGAFAFSAFSFSENTFFFSIMLAVSTAVFLFSGPKCIRVYPDRFTVFTQGLIKPSLFKRTFYFKDLKEISADLPDDITEMVLRGTDRLFSRYRFVVLPQEEIQRTYWISADQETMRKAVEMIKEKVMK